MDSRERAMSDDNETEVEESTYVDPTAEVFEREAANAAEADEVEDVDPTADVFDSATARAEDAEVEGESPVDSPESFSIPAIQEWVADHPDDAQAVLDAEEARGKQARTSLVSWLESRVD
jgi:hypothetical protein